jgi:hypothetical protein
MGRTKHDFDPAADEAARKERARKEADRMFDEAAPKKPAATMEEAAAQDAERQQDEAAAAREAAEDAKFRSHLAGLGGAQLVGDLTKATLEIVDQLMKRHGNLKRGWKGLAEHDQKDVISRAEWAAKGMVAAAVSAVAANRFPSLSATLDVLNIKDGYKVVLKAPTNPDVLPTLGASQGKQVVLVLADPTVFGQHEPIKPLKDQPPLPGVPEESDAAESAAAEDGPIAGGESPLAEVTGGQPVH